MTNKNKMQNIHCLSFSKNKRSGQKGFSLVELLLVIGVIGILSAIAVPSYLHWLPGIRLKSAARDMYSNLQLARIQALKENSTVSVRFDTGNDTYYYDTDGNNNYTAGEFRIFLNGYKSGIAYGSGSAVNNWNADAIIIDPTEISFTNSGTANSDSVFIENEEADICYAITVLTSGTIKLRKFNGVGWN